MAGSSEPCWLGGFFSPQGFLSAAQQDYAHQAGIALDELHMELRLVPASGPPDHVPLVTGLSLNGASWRDELADMHARDGPAVLPPLMFVRSDAGSTGEDVFTCPVFHTAQRAGDGENSSVAVLTLPAGPKGASHWIARGVAAVLES